MEKSISTEKIGTKNAETNTKQFMHLFVSTTWQIDTRSLDKRAELKLNKF